MEALGTERGSAMEPGEDQTSRNPPLEPLLGVGSAVQGGEVAESRGMGRGRCMQFGYIPFLPEPQDVACAFRFISSTEIAAPALVFVER
jgi:hypothetical protein